MTEAELVTKIYKVLVMGGAGTGKTTMCQTLLTFNSEVEIDNIKCRVEVVDTDANQVFQIGAGDLISKMDAFVIVFNITDYESFEAAKKLLIEVWKLRHETRYPLVVVGNKSDLESAREVTSADAAETAVRCHGTYMEISATDCPEDVRNVFAQVVRETRKPRDSGSEIRYEGRGGKGCCVVL